MRKKEKSEEINAEEKYADIIDLPHHVSEKRSAMPVKSRAAQFASFAALTGHKDAVKEEARVTSKRIELDEYERERLDEMLRLILTGEMKEWAGQIESGDDVSVAVTYFVPDDRKEGGAYVTTSGKIIKADAHKRQLLMDNGTVIPTDEVIAIEFSEQW